ncbi:methyltransferase domain-containing protein [Williamwhitmania taraxaci]|uniref:Methyltransferase domain-containing protein n=1 Tax=Williamwhitmania taraxaci TaxID=1640674 RepID=A0A1G6SUJ4_9BACT|nr:methyltransferase domain-containing protein [Williamwhitmania taraxaci]SDD19946.1 Methyltransferase domain-containing protein [Williamwhitmania taraxaci]
MVSFKNRSGQSEMMDAPDIPVKLLHKNLGELDILNRYLGGHSISIEGIKRLMIDRRKIYHIVDLGCGSGDVLKYIAQWARSNQYEVKLTGIDKNPDAIQYLINNCSDYPEITGKAIDYKDFLKTNPKVDIVHCSLFCHHLNNQELLELFSYLKTYTSEGFVVNDLQRSPIAYYSVWFLTRLLNGSALSKHDGPISVLRAFTRNELEQLFHNADIQEISIQWRWAFRYLIVAKTAR